MIAVDVLCQLTQACCKGLMSFMCTKHRERMPMPKADKAGSRVQQQRDAALLVLHVLSFVCTILWVGVLGCTCKVKIRSGTGSKIRADPSVIPCPTIPSHLVFRSTIQIDSSICKALLRVDFADSSYIHLRCCHGQINLCHRLRQ